MRWNGRTPIVWIAGEDGVHRFTVSPVMASAGAGSYRLTVRGVAAPTEQDEVAAAAAKTSTELKRLIDRGTADSLRQAMLLSEDAIRRWTAAEEPIMRAQSHNSAGWLHIRFGESQKAMDRLEKALAIYRECGDPSGEAEVLLNQAAAHSARGDKRAALGIYRQAASLNEAVGNPRGKAYCLSNTASILFSLGETSASLEASNEALKLWRAAGDKVGENQARIGIGLAHLVVGEPRAALQHFTSSLELARAIGDRRGAAHAHLGLGNSYGDLGEYDRAFDHFSQAVPILQEVSDLRSEAVALGNLGSLRLRRGDYAGALEGARQSLDKARGVDKWTEIDGRLTMALAERGMGDDSSALRDARTTQQLARTAGHRRAEAGALRLMGHLEAAHGRTEAAQDRFAASLSLWEAARYRNEAAKTLGAMAELDLNEGRMDRARAALEKALEAVEAVSASVTGESLKSAYAASTHSHYELYIELLMRLHAERPSSGFDGLALHASERARARAFLESLASTRADIRRDADASLLAREQEIRRQVNLTAYRLARIPALEHDAASQRASAEKELDRLVTRLRDVQAEIRAKAPRYATLTQPDPLTAVEIGRTALDEETLLLEYALGERGSYVWAVTTDSLRSHPLPPRSEIEQNVEEFLRRLPKSREEPSLFQAAARALAQQIVDPVSGELTRRRLLIVADGLLHKVPFAALPGPGPGAGAHLLVDEHTVIYAPSASSVAALRRHRPAPPPTRKTAAVFADPVFDAQDSRVRRPWFWLLGKPEPPATSSFRGDIVSLQRLPFSRAEARSIASLVPPDDAMVALDFAASRANVENSALRDYRVVHFATHAFADTRHPELTGIVLSLVGPQGEPRDGFLRLHEIYNMDLGADLVVASACETALGKAVRGEGLHSLTRGFLYAGAQRVLASLWRVDDEATAELMRIFYREMLEGQRAPDEALQAAQIEIRRNDRWSSPHTWAGFVLHGDWK